MKRKLILIVLFGLVPFLTIFAQTDQGKVLLGISTRYSISPYEIGISSADIMTIGFSTIKFKSDASSEDESESLKFNCINLIPKVGYFVINNLALGLDVNIGMSSIKETYDEGESKSTSSVLTAGPFVRYYFPLGKAFPFIEAGASLGSMKSKYEYDSETDEYVSSLNSITGGVGIAALLNDKVSFDFLVGYLSTTLKDKEDNPNNERMVIGTLGFKFGVVLFL
ncbi:MAG: hypothetical protein CVT94_04415 [Bacteroidetes bacterium HGW-Bacteroidetes-11]|jgi:outer membrane protein|nr:MAG: hypothetical protein CVT94_04415 [Bacteroidetes bacterium HGW-Bacteroidetes-11]